VTTSVDTPSDDRVSVEARDELGRLVDHPLEELKRLEHVAAEGESASTPLILVLAVGGFFLLVTGAVIGVSLAVYYGI
jgi:hypothetical protein